jgi:hypothetical protein
MLGLVPKLDFQIIVDLTKDFGKQKNGPNSTISFRLLNFFGALLHTSSRRPHLWTWCTFCAGS